MNVFLFYFGLIAIWALSLWVIWHDAFHKGWVQGWDEATKAYKVYEKVKRAIENQSKK